MSYLARNEDEPYPWRRLTHLLGLEHVRRVYHFDAHGWLLTPEAWGAPDVGVVVASMDGLRDVSAIVLVGPSGIGKTNVLREEQKAAVADGDTVTLVDLKSLRATAVRSEQIGLLPTPTPSGRWHVLLDSFDEAIRLVPGLIETIRAWLETLSDSDLGRLRLRVATRPGERNNTELIATMRALWPNVQVREIAPLTREEVLTAARAVRLPDPEAFLAELERRGLGAVASMPVPLKALLRRASRRQGLPDIAGDAYDQACQQLCEEANPDRSRPPGLTIAQLMRCAERLAVAVQFGDGVLTSLREDPGYGTRLTDLADGTEEAPGAPCTEEALRWLTDTALLKPLAEDQWQFAHRSLQEFLAARYLLRRQVPAPVLRSLLLAGVGPIRHVASGHFEVAGWVAWERPELRSEILAVDPRALLGPDLRSQPAEVRGQVVDALMAELAVRPDKELAGLMPVLNRVDHDGLADRLAPHLLPATDRDGQDRLTLAMMISTACPAHAPEAALLDLAENDQAPEVLRHDALGCLPKPVTALAAERLRTLANGGGPLAVVASGALWPDYLDTQTLLGRLTAADAWQLRNLPERFGDGDVDHVLSWLHEQLTEINDIAAVSPLLRALFWALRRARPGSGAHTEKFGVVLAALVANTEALHNPEIGGWQAVLAADEEWRRALAEQVLAAIDLAHIPDAVHGPLGLFPAADSAYWARRAAAEPSSFASKLGSPLLLPRPDDSDLANIATERQANCALAELTETWFRPASDQRRDELNERNLERIATRRELIANDLERLLEPDNYDPAQARKHWAATVQVLHQDPDGTPHPWHDALDLRTARNSPAEGSARHSALVALAQKVLRDVPAVTAAAVGPSGLFYQDYAEITALPLCATPPVLDPARWSGLALVLTLAQGRREEEQVRVELLDDAVAAAGDFFTTALPEALDRLGPLVVHDAVQRLLAIADAALAGELMEWTRSPRRSTAKWAAAIRALTANEHSRSEALRELRTEAVAPPPNDDAAALERWALATEQLLMLAEAEECSRLWQAILSRDETMVAWARACEASFSTGNAIFTLAPVQLWPAAFHVLRPQQIGTLYDVLVQAHVIPAPSNPAGTFLGIGHHLKRLPELLAVNNSLAASTELQRLADRYPDHVDFRITARQHARRTSEHPPLRWSEVRQLTERRDRRLVRDASDLAELVTEALDELQRQCLQSHGWSNLMWNRADEKATDGWWPAWEDHLSNLVRSFLTEHLHERRPVINREVEIHPVGLAGQRADILVQAEDINGGMPLTLVIEVKGCWNREIDTAVNGQLVDRYLLSNPSWSGVFLVGYLHHTHEARSYTKRHRTTRGHSPKDVAASLARQARRATDAGYIVHTRVLELPLVPANTPLPAPVPRAGDGRAPRHRPSG